MEETGLLLEASVSEFGETQWNLLPSSYTVCGLFSRTVEAAAGSGHSLRLTYPGTVLSL